ncbi:MAG: shikimate kinase [Lachnospiraceae bacterium]
MNNVILIGFMGCGKSTVGIRLSYKLRRVVEDTDKLIEKKEDKSISNIFQEKGEPYFRELETECLRELLSLKEDKIISTGGGLPMKRENHPLLKSLGTVVYLRITPQSVWERLKNDTTRPLLQCEDPLARIKELLAERAPVYEEAADVIIDVDGKDMEQVLSEILERLQQKGCLMGGIESEDFSD